MTIEVTREERVVEWATFKGETTYDQGYAYSRVFTEGQFYALYHEEQIRRKAKGEKGSTRPMVSFGDVSDLSYYNDDVPNAENASLTWRASIFTGIIERLQKGESPLEAEGQFQLLLEKDQREGSSLPAGQKVRYTTTCGQQYDFMLEDLVLVADWLENG